MKWLRRQWAELTHVEQRLFYIGWTVGGVLFAIGVVGDSRDWWSEHSYLLELVSGLTAFAVGIPLAVTVIRRFEDHTDELAIARNALATARRLAAGLIDSYFQSTWRVLGQPSTEPSRSLPSPLSDEVMALLHRASIDISVRLGVARDECNSADVHDVMASLAEDLEDEMGVPDVALAMWAALMWQTDVPSLVRMGAGKIAAQTPNAREAWDYLAPDLSLPLQLLTVTTWEAEERADACKYLENLQSFYSEAQTLLDFSVSIIQFTQKHVSRS
jgi:hypothetical protein